MIGTAIVPQYRPFRVPTKLSRSGRTVGYYRKATKWEMWRLVLQLHLPGRVTIGSYYVSLIVAAVEIELIPRKTL